MPKEISVEWVLAQACVNRTIPHEVHARLEQEMRELRRKGAAQDFLDAYGRPDPVPGATLGEYLDAARTYATDYAPLGVKL